MLDAGVDVLFFTQFVEPVVADGRVTHVVLFNKSGLFAVPAARGGGRHRGRGRGRARRLRR